MSALFGHWSLPRDGPLIQHCGSQDRDFSTHLQGSSDDALPLYREHRPAEFQLS